MKFFAISRWNSTGKEFVSSTLGCDTKKEACEIGMMNERTYKDQKFLRVISCENWNAAKNSLTNRSDQIILDITNQM